MSVFEKQIFIVGNGRSGTTLLSRSLGKHSKIYRFKELHYYEGVISDPSKKLTKEEAVITLSRLFWKQREAFLSKIDDDRYTKEAESLLKPWGNHICPHELFHFYLKYLAQKNGCPVACEQTPRNLFFADEILNNFPNALIINMVRDPRAIAFSQKNKWKINKLNGFDVPLLNSLRLFFNYHSITVAKLWSANIRKAKLFEADQRFLTIKFEEFLHNPEYFLKKICKRLSVEYEEKMLEVEIAGSSFKEDYTKKGFDISKIAKWKNSNLRQTEIYLCQKFTGKELKHYGYEKLSTQVNILHLFGEYCTFPLKMAIALILNISRNKNVIRTIARRLSALKIVSKKKNQVL
jgi:omega-hydroxy-beta-dihydromenaquinone-9 sulfotransferase